MTTESIKEKIELSRTELLDLSLRNPLLNYKLLTAKGVEAVGANPVEVFGALVRDGASMRFLDAESKSTARNRLRTGETAEQLERRLLKTYTDARTLIEEQGVNTLFIALGIVHWYDADSSDLERKAPLILLPVRLERANVNAGFTLRYSGEDTGANIVFIQKAKKDFNIDIPELPEDEENDAEDIDVATYFSAVARSIKRMKRWNVDRESVVLGFFSFNKLLMHRDLDADMWPEGSAPAENDIIRALFEDGFREAESAIGEDDHLDDHLKPEDAHHVVDADSSQAKAIYDVNNGRNLIIQGPPGTGKSQTITNIIAEGVAQDKTILFVAEKMAALEVVKRRLDSIGVGVACLELHSHKTQKKAVIDELRKTLELGEPSIEGIDDDFVALEQRQDSLNDYAEAVNLSVGDTGITPYRAYGELIRIKAQQNDKPLRSLRVRGIDSWPSADFQRKFGIVSELQTILRSVGIPQKHTFRGAQLRVATPLTEADISDEIESALESLETLSEAAGHLSGALGLDTPEDTAQVEAILPLAEYAAKAPNIKDVSLRDLEQPADRDKINELLELRERWERLHSEFDDTLKAEAWNADVSEAHRVLSTTEHSCWRSLISPRYRCARNQLATLFRTTPPGDVESLNALGKLVELLGNALGLQEPETIAQIKDLLAIAEYAAEAPSIKDVSLRELEQRANRDKINELLELRERWERLHSEFDDTLKAEAWNADVSEAHRVLSTTGRSFFGRLISPAYRRARNEIMALSQAEPTREVEQQIALAKSILEEQQTRRAIENLSTFAETVLGQWWRGEHSDWNAIRRIVEWALNLLEDVDRGKVNSALVFAMSDESDANMVNELHTQAHNALENHRIIVEIECSDAKIERQIALAKSILEEQQTRRAIENLSTFAETALGQWWRGEHSDWNAIRRIAEWALNLLEDVDRGNVNSALVFAMSDEIDATGVQDTLKRTQSAVENHGKRLADIEITLELDNSIQFGNTGGLHTMPFETQKNVLAEWEANVGSIRDMARFNGFVDNAKNEDLDAVVKLIWNWEEAATLLTARFENARYNAILSRAIKERPSLASFDPSVHSQRIREFREMDELALVHNRARVAHIHWDALPQYDGGGQLGILRREFAKKRRYLSVRELVDRAGNAIQAIKPVFMMSPLSVAKYLKPGAMEFDLAVFDEASQVRPVDALGALLRAKQVVVVGDDKQLPPTNFFSASIQGDEEDEEDSATADMESILGLFSASGAPNRMLRWHYRSRHESLIAVSNSEFYENRLVVFPSPDSDKRDFGLQYHWVDTKYEGRGRNREEAAHVARAVMEHARLHPELSLGVATFSSGQRDAVQDELEALRHQTDAYESFFNSHSEEPFFIKNLENVQGDERDVIFISVGYGRNAEGRVYQNFGPLNRDGGERRLNVLISRAKLRCHVFTNLQSDDIMLTSNSKGGVQAIKKFLAFAERGEIPDMPIVSGREAGSPFQKAVADRLRSQGYEIHDEVASSGYFVDIGVVDPKRPGRYVLGIECDGATYHGSRSARERDRLRESVLVGLGWRIHRIWSADWFNNPEQELKRAVEAIEDALASQPAVRVSQNGDKSHIQPTDARSKTPAAATASTPVIQRADTERKSRKLIIPPYELTYPVVYTGYSDDLGNTPISYLLEPLIAIVDTEGPVHQDEVIRRITNAAGLRRVGNRIRRNLGWAIDNAVRRKQIRRKGDFLWSPDMEHPTVRDRTALEVQQKKIEYIASEEIAEAILMAVEHSYGINREEAIRDAANLLGLRRVTKDVGDKLDTAVDSLLKDKRIRESDGHLILP